MSVQQLAENLRDETRSLVIEAEKNDAYEFDGEKARRMIKQDLNPHTKATLEFQNIEAKLHKISTGDGDEAELARDIGRKYYQITSLLPDNSFLNGMIKSSDYWNMLVELCSELGVDHRNVN